MMLITFVFSMFVSNTATTVMMLTAIIPIINNLDKNDNFSKALLLGIAISANLGGMGTIIGTPPNAIAVGALGDLAPDFLTWMIYAVPPAIFLVIFLAFTLLKLYPPKIKHITFYFENNQETNTKNTQKYIVIVTFLLTLSLWLSSSIHHIPTAVVAFIPIVVFTVSGVIDTEDIRNLPWDVLFLITGGLSLGLAVSKTGLAAYLANLLPFEAMSSIVLILSFSYLIIIISNFMSNTAATNVLMPILIALVSSLYPSNTQLLIISSVIVALSASNAMCLPVSTPPNALVYSTNKLNTKDFLLMGIISGTIAPLVIFGWFYIIILKG
jgi:sodium-dependent dicarboxylate transporter 2/3/5